MSLLPSLHTSQQAVVRLSPYYSSPSDIFAFQVCGYREFHGFMLGPYNHLFGRGTSYKHIPNFCEWSWLGFRLLWSGVNARGSVSGFSDTLIDPIHSKLFCSWVPLSTSAWYQAENDDLTHSLHYIFLWIKNRYMTPLGFVVNIIGELSACIIVDFLLK